MTWIWRYTATANDGVNLLPTTGAWVLYYVKEMLKQGGVVCKSSSDATTYNATGDQITTGNSGAGGSGNTNAWWRGQFPDGREILIQRGTTGRSWLVVWSHSATFIGGSPGATRRPTATDEQFVCGGGTDVSPTFFTFWPTDATYRLHMGMDNAAPYNFYAIAGTNGTGALVGRFWLVNMASGSYPTEDVAPYLVDVNTGSAAENTMGALTLNTGGLGQGYYRKGLSNEAWVNFRAMSIGSTGQSYMGSPSNLGLDPYNGKEGLESIFVGRRDAVDANSGRKGRAPLDMLGWTNSVRASMQDFFDTAGGDRYAYLGHLALRWPPGITPVR